MPAIDIISMRGEMPRVLSHMLPDAFALLARNCHFRFGVITPVNDDVESNVTFGIKPETIFLYRKDKWFTWQGMVDAVRSPVAQDPYGRVYYTDGKYPKFTSAQIATSGAGPYPTTSYRLGVPASGIAITCTVLNPPPVEGADENDAKDDETRFYTQTFVTAYGEEGPPGPESMEVTVKKGGSVNLTMQPPPLQNSNITRRRIYRSVSGGGNADFLLVTELDAGVLSFHDDLLAEQLGPVLETEHYVITHQSQLQLKNLRKQRDEVYSDPTLTARQQADRVLMIEQNMKKVVDRFNREYRDKVGN